MVKDFTKIGIQPKPAEASNPLTEAVRSGVPSQSGLAGVRLGLEKMAGEQPMGIDAPTKGLRKAIGSAGELLTVLEFGFGGVFFLLLGLACSYLGIREGFDLNVLGFGAGSLALGAFLARKALQAVRNLRSIAKA